MVITIKVEAPELITAINNLAHSLSNLSASGNAVSELIEQAVEKHVETLDEQPAAPVKEKAKTAPALAPAPKVETVSLETVRARLGELGREGKTDAVKKLIAEFGAAKLADVHADQLGELLEKANQL